MLTNFFEQVKKYQSDIIIGLAVMLMTYIGYNVGKLMAFNSLKTPVTVTDQANLGNIVRHDGEEESIVSPRSDLSVVASSKSTTHLYHFKWCPGAGQISATNLITFKDEAAAIAAGYKLASNCKK